MLNLFTNALYAMNKRLMEVKAESNSEYKPVLSINVSRNKHSVIILIRDNGGGIPADIREKIFEPFFTTKPSGEGTGLGLSISYDIVKAHGGELKVESGEGEFTEFTISLPLIKN